MNHQKSDPTCGVGASTQLPRGPSSGVSRSKRNTLLGSVAVHKGNFQTTNLPPKANELSSTQLNLSSTQLNKIVCGASPRKFTATPEGQWFKPLQSSPKLTTFYGRLGALLLTDPLAARNCPLLSSLGPSVQIDRWGLPPHSVSRRYGPQVSLPTQKAANGLWRQTRNLGSN